MHVSGSIPLAGIMLMSEYMDAVGRKKSNRAAALALKRRPCYKEKHKSIGKADAQLRSLLQRGLAQMGEMDTYFCTGCQAWHVGHKRRKLEAIRLDEGLASKASTIVKRRVGSSPTASA